MTMVFEGAPKFGGISGDHARVTAIEDRVLIRAIDAMAEEPVTIAMTPDQARALAAGIVAAANDAEAHQPTMTVATRPAPDAVAHLVEAAQALGATPEGYCFCSTNRIGDDSKAHEPECADLRAALVKMENEQCQVSIGPAIGATINGLHGSGAGAPDAVDNSYPDMVARLVEAAIAEYLLEPPFQTELERMGRKATARGMMVRLGIYEKFKEALAAMEKPQ